MICVSLTRCLMPIPLSRIVRPSVPFWLRAVLRFVVVPGIVPGLGRGHFRLRRFVVPDRTGMIPVWRFHLQWFPIHAVPDKIISFSTIYSSFHSKLDSSSAFDVLALPVSVHWLVPSIRCNSHCIDRLYHFH